MNAKLDQFTQEFRRGGWRALIVSAIGYAFGMTVLPFYTLGSFVAPLEADLGWSRAEVQGALMAVVVATLMGAWGAGWLTDRFGVKRVAAWSQLGLGVSLVGLGLIPAQLGYWYGGWFLMTLVGLGTSPISWTRSVAAWFDSGRGLALALALSGSGLCPLIAPGLTALMIEHHGWRLAYVGLGGAVLLLALPVTLLLMPGDRPPPEDETQVTDVSEDGVTLQAAFTGYRFWLLLVSLMMAGFAVSGLIPNLIPLMVDRGVDSAVAAGLMGVLGVSIIIGRLTTGFALDRLWAPIVAFIVLPLPALGCLVLATEVSDYATLTACIMVLGLATGAEFDLAPFLVTRYFGMARYSQIYALQWMGFTIAAGSAPAIFGHVHDVHGSYDLALYACTALFLAAPALLLLLGRYPVFSSASGR